MWFDFVVIMAVFRAIQLFFRRRPSSDLGSDGLLKLTVGKSFQALYGGRVYQALRIPETGSREHQVLDVVLLTDRDLYIFSVQGLSGIVRRGNDDVWLETDMNGNVVEHPNAVTELKNKAAVLAHYLIRRGATLPKDLLKLRVVFVNAMARPEQEILLLPEVLSYDRWDDIQKKASSSSFFGFESGLSSPSTSKSPVDSPSSQLHYILSTAPTWDRLELRGGGILFGDFVRFKGPLHDVEALNVAKRTKISHYEAIHKWSFWGFLGIHTVTEIKVECSLRDYRQGSSIRPIRPTKVEIQVQGDVEILFQAKGTTKPRAFEFRDVSFLSLHA